MTPSPLTDALKDFLPPNTPEPDIHTAARNLGGFMQLLIDIERAQRTAINEGAD